MCFLHSCFQVCSREATLPQGADVVCGGKKQDLNFLCLPPPCQEAPGLQLSPAKALQPLASPLPGQHRRVGRGGGGSLASPHLLCRFFSSTSCSLSVGRGGERFPSAEQSCTDVKKEVFWLPLLSRGTGRGTSAALLTAAALGMVDGLRLCCRVGHGTGPALTWAQWLCPCWVSPSP